MLVKEVLLDVGDQVGHINLSHASRMNTGVVVAGYSVSKHKAFVDRYLVLCILQYRSPKIWHQYVQGDNMFILLPTQWRGYHL